MEDKMYSVSEAVRLIGVESHVLRYWEEELQIVIDRTSQGHRIYSRENIDTFRQVKKLKEKGIQLKAIRVLLEEMPGQEKERQDEERVLYTACEVLLPEVKPDNLTQFEHILKQMIREVVEEQNEKLQRTIAQMLRAEVEELYLQYYHLPVQETAAAVEKKKDGRMKDFLCRMKLLKRV